MEASALLKAIEKNLDDMCAKKIFAGVLPATKYRYRNFVQKIQAKIRDSDVKAQFSLNEQLHNLLKDVEKLVTDFRDNLPDASTYPAMSSTKRDILIRQMKLVMHELERVAHEGEYFISEKKKLVGESEITSLGEGEYLISEKKKLVGESEITSLGEVGREKEKEEIIDKLMYFNRSTTPVTGVPVITITGLAGIGKTLLALLVCEHNEVKQKVGMPVWVNDIRDDTFNPDMIAEQVIDVCRRTLGTENPNIFVILDDLRVEIMDGHLKALKDRLDAVPLRVAAIMITTRSSHVVRNIADSSVNLYVLRGLNEEESMCLFQTIVGLFAGDNSVFVSSIAEDVRRKIVAQCRGVPLAIVIMAKLFYACPSPSRFTQLVKEDFLLELANFYYNEGVPLYFSYFSVFPQDYWIDAERLIHLWMAEGFLNSSNPSTSESDREAIGRGYLRDLVDRSIFQDVKKDEFGVVRSCRMHPLMHDIARFMANREDNINGNGQNFLRASFDLSTDFSRGIPETLRGIPETQRRFIDNLFPTLRSIFFFATTGSRLPLQMEMSRAMIENISKRFRSLCVLDLRGLRIKRVPSSIGKLSELVYLDLSQNDMKKLPSSITKLSKLQTLKLSRCYSLKELPNKFEKLTRLEHLDLEGCVGLTGMPRNMSKLSSMRTLPAFVASKNDPEEGLQQLASLTKLRSEQHLEILHMERVQRMPSEELLLHWLTLRWDLSVDHPKLKFFPSPHLRVLILVGYRNYLTSNCLFRLEFLFKLSLHDCHKLEDLPVSWSCPNLKILELIRLDNLEFIEHVFDRTEPLCSKLEEVVIADCPKLKSWWAMQVEEEERPFFANISKLHVHHCPLLTSMPLYPHLDQELVLVDSSFKPLLESITYATDAQGFSKLKSMVVSSVTFNPLQIRHIQNFNHLENLSACFKHMSSLQRLTIENCEEIDLDGKSNQWEGLESLRFLTVRTIPILSTFSFGGNLTTLRELTLHNCLGLTSISDNIDKVTSLRRLSISRCNKLESLPKTMKDLQSLNTLIILDCILLLPRCQPETGHDWPQIRHIKHIQVK